MSPTVLRELLELLREELESDVAKAQTRDQHMRSCFRVKSVKDILEQLEIPEAE